MKNSLLVTTTALMMIQMLLTISCARHSEMDKGSYLEVPKAKHEKQFPHGHGTAPPEGENCYFNKATNSYFCEFDWFE